METRCLYDLEEKIMAAWSVVDDIKLLAETQSNPAKPLVFEAIKNYSWDQENSDIVWFTKKHQHKIA